MIWDVIKQSAIDIWDEILYLMIFNIIWLIGTILIIPWPFVTFALFAIVYDVGQGKGIGLAKFFSYGRRAWKQAYIWGLINLGMFIVVLVNINFYSNITARWAGSVQVLIFGLALFWVTLQLVTLSVYPRLEEPGFRLAIRNAAVLIGQYVPAILVLMVIVATIGIVSFITRWGLVLTFLGTFSIIAVVTNRMVGAMIKKELRRRDEET